MYSIKRKCGRGNKNVLVWLNENMSTMNRLLRLAECSLCISLVSMVYLESKNSLFAIQREAFCVSTLKNIIDTEYILANAKP